ncbi:MAG: hypothetical protein K6C98_07095 [Treponema sp.]|nr:hypothetical protein [Treponema sp.]
MKKFISLCAVLCLFGFALCAEQNYIVRAVSGKVTYREKDGSWSPVKVGMRMSDSMKVATGLNSTMIVVSGAENSIVILPLKTGSLKDVVAYSSDNNLIRNVALKKD